MVAEKAPAEKEMVLPDLAGPLAGWGLVPLEAAKVRAAYCVVTPLGKVALKPAQEDGRRLLVMDEAHQYLAGRGFHQVVPFLSTGAGEPYHEWGGRRWVASPWIAGREADYQAPGELARCAGTLAALHQAGLGFRPTRGKLRSVIGKWPAKLRRRAALLESHLAEARGRVRPTEFEAVLVSAGETLVDEAQLAVAALARSPYAERCTWAERARPLCHGDPSDRNFILGEDGLVHVIDLGGAKCDLPELDLGRLLRRTMRRTGWDFPLAAEMLAAYDRVSLLDHDARSVMEAALRFPDKAWRLLKQYYRDDGLDPEWKEARLARKLRRTIALLPRKRFCLRLLGRI